MREAGEAVKVMHTDLDKVITKISMSYKSLPF